MAEFSIILPVYNGGEHVKLCVASILTQTYKDFELTVLDNCSTDGTLEWLKTQKDDRIRIIESSETLSMEQNWDRVKRFPKNEFMTIIGHDDILMPRYLEIMKGLIHKHPKATLYQCHFNFIDAKGKLVRSCLPMEEVQYAQDFLATQMQRTMDSMGTGYMMRSLDYDGLGGIPVDYPRLIFADYELWTRLILKGYKATSPEFGFEYRIHESISRLTNGDDYVIAFGKYMQFMDELVQRNEAIKKVVEKYGHSMLLYFCESLSHRLLKTPPAQRKITVDTFIVQCKAYANQLIPGQSFKPLQKSRISIARQLDSNSFTRSLFYNLKKK